MMYIVWHSDGKRDGDSSFDDIDDANEEFDHQTQRRGIVEVELVSFDNPHDDAPKQLRYWSAVQNEC